MPQAPENQQDMRSPRAAWRAPALRDILAGEHAPRLDCAVSRGSRCPPRAARPGTNHRARGRRARLADRWHRLAGGAGALQPAALETDLLPAAVPLHDRRRERTGWDDGSDRAAGPGQQPADSGRGTDRGSPRERTRGDRGRRPRGLLARVRLARGPLLGRAALPHVALLVLRAAARRQLRPARRRPQSPRESCSASRR